MDFTVNPTSIVSPAIFECGAKSVFPGDVADVAAAPSEIAAALNFSLRSRCCSRVHLIGVTNLEMEILPH